MKNCDIINALAQKVIDTIYDEWHHDGHIEVEHSNDFEFTLDGKLYGVELKEMPHNMTSRAELEVSENK